MNAVVGIIMGSRTDWDTMQHASQTLDELGVAHEVKIVSAHRTPDLLYDYGGPLVLGVIDGPPSNALSRWTARRASSRAS